MNESLVREARRDAVASSGLTKRAACHTLGHAFAAFLLERGYDFRTVQELLGRCDVKTTMIYYYNDKFEFLRQRIERIIRPLQRSFPGESAATAQPARPGVTGEQDLLDHHTRETTLERN